MLKIIFIVVLCLSAAFVVLLFQQGRVSANQQPPMLDANGRLPPCSDKPNCVSSSAPPTDQSHYIAPIRVSGLTLDDLRSAIMKDGGQIISINNKLLTATYKSRLFGFIDDLMLLQKGDEFQVRSSSRVGHSDMSANRKRVERLRSSISSE